MRHRYLGFFIGHHKFLKSISECQGTYMLTIELSVYSLGGFQPTLFIFLPKKSSLPGAFLMSMVLWRRMIRDWAACPPTPYSSQSQTSCCRFRWSVYCLIHDVSSSGGTDNIWSTGQRKKQSGLALHLRKRCNYLLNGIMNKLHKFILQVGELFCIHLREIHASTSSSECFLSNVGALELCSHARPVPSVWGYGG